MYQNILFSLIRWALGLGGAWLIKNGHGDVTSVNTLIGGVVALLPAIWAVVFHVNNHSAPVGLDQNFLGQPIVGAGNTAIGRGAANLLLLGFVVFAFFVATSGFAQDTNAPAAAISTNVPNTPLLQFLLTSSTNPAAPAVTITPNPKLANAVSFMSTLQMLGQTTTIGGVFTLLGDGDYGEGVAIQWRPLHIDLKQRTRIFFGPSLITCSGRNSTRELLELSLSTKVIDGAAVQAAFQKIPLIGSLPIDVSEIAMFFGVGPRIDADVSSINTLVHDSGASFGATGIRWGN